MNVEEGYYYFVSGSDHTLDKFRKIQPLQPLHFWKDIYYYPFQRSQNFYRLKDLFDKKNYYKLDIPYIQNEIKKTSEKIYGQTSIIPNMQFEHIYIQYEIEEEKSQLCKNYYKQSTVVFVESTNLKSFQETQDEFKKYFDEFILSYSQVCYLENQKNIKNKKNNSTSITKYFYKVKENFSMKNQKQQQTYLSLNLQDYIRCQSNQIDIQKIQEYMEILNQQNINWIDFELNFLKINNIEKILKQPQVIYILQQLQQYCIVVDAINSNYNVYGEIVLYVTQIKSYLNLQDNILDIENFSFQLMSLFVVPQLKKNGKSQSFSQILYYNESIIKTQIQEYIKKKVNEL